ncbi:MAG: hypothetical protein N7Q72_04230 [Spiroplasma sp. Tabriz.8]|nr:hypothetical protein [Spiroplasma sp. Tabriz.8]
MNNCILSAVDCNKKLNSDNNNNNNNNNNRHGCILHYEVVYL